VRAASADTRRAALTVQSNGWGDVEAAAADLARLIERECGAKSRIEVLDRMRPTAQARDEK
jgi:hypothetical protein